MKNTLFSVLLVAVFFGMVACDEKNAPTMGPGKETNSGSTAVYDTVQIPASVVLPEGAITVTEARQICSQLASGTNSTEYYYVHGWVKKLHSANTDAITGNYHNAQFYIAQTRKVDANGIESYDEDDFYAYRVKGLNNGDITDVNGVQIGDYVVLYCKLTNYQGTYETPMNSGSYIYSSTNESLTGNDDSQPNVDDATVATIAEVLAAGADLSVGKYSDEYFKVTAYLTSVSTSSDKVAQYGNINITLKDETGTIDSYYTKNVDNTNFTSADQVPALNSKIVVIGRVYRYNEATLELKDGYISEVLEVGDGEQKGEIEASLSCIFSQKAMPEGWSLVVSNEVKNASSDDFYSDNSLKLTALNKGVESPVFEAVDAVNVSFNISKLNAKQLKDATDGTFEAIGYNATGNEVAKGQVSVNATGIFNISLEGQGIVKVRLVMTQFPYNGTYQCNAALKEVGISWNN